MPPYGLYSLANTPEELLNRGYGYGGDIPIRDLSEAERNITFYGKRDPAFGTISTDFGYFPAPFTGAQPFQNASFLRGDRGEYNLGFLGDFQIPSFGGSSNINYNQYNPKVQTDYFEPFESTGIMKQAPLDMNRFQGVSDMSAIDETTNDEQDEEYIDLVDPSNNKSGGIIDLIMSAVMPGYNFIKGALNKPQSYQQFSPGTSIRNGIVSIDGVNTPYGNFGGDFYNPNTGLNRFDRARNRFNKTGSTVDLFGSSRTGKEFFENRRRIKEQKAKDLLDQAKNKRTFKSLETGGNDRPGGGNRIGDADISNPGKFTTDDTAGFF